MAMGPKPLPVPYKGTSDPSQDEETAVHQVYEQIAPHFSSTRYKPWPLIETFLHSLPPHSIGLDSGAGNGKYLPVARSAGVEMIAMDRSSGLLDIAKQHGECVRGDLCGLNWRRGVFDFAISIAAVHHLSTPERRRQSIQALIHPLRLVLLPPYSRFMVYVWAYEQGKDSKRRMGIQATDGTTPLPAASATDTQGDTNPIIQDFLVPWVLQKPEPPKKKLPPSSKQTSPALADSNEPVKSSNSGEGKKPDQVESPQVFHRYYHLFVKGELENLVEEAARETGYEILERDDPPNNKNGSLASGQSSSNEGEGLSKFMRIRGVGWEADNWWLEGEVGYR